MKGDLTLDVDAVVVGAGAGGAAAAFALAEKGLRVAVLEEGHRWQPHQFPARYGWALNHIYADKGARIAQSKSIFPMPAGRGVGGSTLINSAICYRAPDHVLERWSRDLGLDALAPSKLAPLYELVEATIGVRPMTEFHARGNNLFVKRGAEKLGLDGAFIWRNAPGCVGCGVCHLGCPSGGKGSVDRNFVPMAEAHGAEIFSDVRVAELLVRRGRVRGVEATISDVETDEQVGRLRVNAERVILSAGAIVTPTILQKQGLANRSGQVGRNLSVHPAVGTFGFVPEDINSWDGVPQAYAVFLDRKAGILLQAYNASPEIFFSSMPWSGADGMRKLKRLKNLALCGAIVSDGPNGQVETGLLGRPKITYSLGDDERKKLLRALRAIVRILFAAGADEVYSGVGAGDELSKSEPEALAQLGDDVDETSMSLIAAHPMGTCRMGVSRATSVARPDGRLHDVEGLYVADASLMPTSLGVNPQVTVMALGLLVGRAAAGA